MTAIVKTKKEMPEDMKLSYYGTDRRGVYGFSMAMQRKMGETIQIMPVGDRNKKLYDYIAYEGFLYRKEWLGKIKK